MSTSLVFAVVVVGVLVTSTAQSVLHSRANAEQRQFMTDVLDRFVEQTKDANQHMSGILVTPPPAQGSPTSAFEIDHDVMLDPFADFDDTDPTDFDIHRERADAVYVEPDDANPFGIPGLGRVNAQG